MRASDGTLYHSHLAIIGMYTDFSTALSSGQFPESKDRTISFPEHDPKAVEFMMTFFYTGEYGIDTSVIVADEGLTIKMWIFAPFEVYRLADYIMVSGLKNVTLIPMKKWFSAIEVTAANEKYKDVLKIIWENHVPDMVHDVYAATNNEERHRKLRCMLVEGVRGYLKIGCDWKVLELVMREDMDLAIDLFGCMEEFRNKK